MRVLELIVVLLALGGGQVVLVLVSPLRRCSWCKGTGRAARHRSWGRMGVCPKCQGLGRQARSGAAVVQRWRLAVAEERRRRRDGTGE